MSVWPICWVFELDQLSNRCFVYFVLFRGQFILTRTVFVVLRKKFAKVGACSRSLMDRTRACGARSVGSIPTGST